MDANSFLNDHIMHKKSSGGLTSSVIALAKRQLASELRRIREGTPLDLQHVMSRKIFPRPHRQVEGEPGG
jgi:hypothetical protein